MPTRDLSIVHISDCYAPRTGGIESQVAHLSQAQRNAGAKVSIITATAGPSQPDVTRVTAPIPFGLPIHPRTRHHLVQVLEKRIPDVAHIHMGATSPFAWGALRAIRQLDIPTVVTVHSMWGGISQRGYSAFEGVMIGEGIVWSAVSNQAAMLVRRALNTDVHILPNGIDVDAWSCDPTASKDLRLVSVLRMAPRKRVGALLKILRTVQESAPEISAHVVGDGPLRQRAEGYARKHRLNVVFTGRLDRTGIKEVFSHSDVFVQASVKESFGIAALEARAAGLLVLARSEAGTSSFIEQGVSGFMVNSDRDIFETLIRLAANMSSVASIKAFNRTHPPAYSWDWVTAEATNLYEAAMSARTQ